MPRRRFELTRDVTTEECDWLARTVPAGTIVYEYTGSTYGAITFSGVACSMDGDTPLFELPRDALEGVPVAVESGSFQT